jgi:hypothetical protein
MTLMLRIPAEDFRKPKDNERRDRYVGGPPKKLDILPSSPPRHI